MSSFDRLHPALQHHIVNSLGWSSLRPLQEQSIETVLAGHHALMLAPTAGGKTEAAIFPLLSRMLSENWQGLSVLYVCPIKALLNSLEPRLSRYCELLGRRCGLWHGDVSDSARRRILRDPPDVLLTTPESLEVLLVSRRVDHAALFANLRSVVVDEIHGFAGDDRGWHLLAVLERLVRVSGRELQRVGLSATVGNPNELLHWLAGHCAGERDVLLPGDVADLRAEVQLDYVGNLDNAALVISRLHRGEKRLVFCDSRARVEQLAVSLRARGVSTFVSHSSLSIDERRQAEEAFSTGSDCVIVATSTLELGIDVGDLDRVIQIDAPSTVSSLLQRMGRTGRRPGAARNCLLLATNDGALLQAAGLLDLWSRGYVEPIVPPACPAHILAQQIMALALQEKGIGVETWREWLGRMPGFASIPAAGQRAVVQHMLGTHILNEDQGIMGFGQAGEKTFGYRNFMELCSVFTSPPLFSVKHGDDEVGSVHESSFLQPAEADGCVLLLGGRSWVVTHLDWDRKVAQVKPSDRPGRSRWMGTGPLLSHELCQAIQGALASRQDSALWSRRARERMGVLFEQYSWVTPDATFLVQSGEDRLWWTFAGSLVNMTLANRVRGVLGVPARGDNLAVRLEEPISADQLRQLSESTEEWSGVWETDGTSPAPLESLKFSVCVPPSLQAVICAGRFAAMDGALRTLRRRLCMVSL
jgi:ATP-dependent Lhr-like helicase